jgi:2-polyprenyl-6-methoxyphenol hydroxylase-like FAD-dependent oxidoreductase
MDPSTENIVLIAGAGVCGLTLANDLAMRDIPFRVIDSLSEPVRESRAHGFGTRTLLALDKLGLVEPMLAAAKQPPPILREYFGGKLLRELDMATVPRDPYPAMLTIFEQRVVRVLEAALNERGHRVEWSTDLNSFEMDDNGILAKVKRGDIADSIRARWIVGCEGSHSVVRKTLSLDAASGAVETSGLRVLFCECDLDWKLSRDIWWLWQDKDGFAGAEYNDFTNKWHLQVLDLQGSDVTLARMEDLLRKRSRTTVHLSNPAWLRPATASQHVAKHFVMGRAALLGDAAHTFSSVAGQGQHFAIEDALNLGWKLALTIDGAAAPSLLQTFETERRERADHAIQTTRLTRRFFNLKGVRARLVWHLLYFTARRFRSVSSTVVKQSAALDMNYSKSPLSVHASTQMTPGTRAGEHTPDALCRIGGRPSRLLEIIRGPQADLLLFAGLSPTPETVHALRAIEASTTSFKRYVRVLYVFPSQGYASAAGMDESDPRVIVDGLEKLHAAFGIRAPEIVFLRPDGYIGLRTQLLEKKALFDYLGLIYAAKLL